MSPEIKNIRESSPQVPRSPVLTTERIDNLSELLDYFGLPKTDTIWPRLNRAFIHRSYRTEANLDEDNERLEFLGDSVIGLAATEYLMKRYREEDEGWLSKLRASVVSRAVLGDLGQQMNLGRFLHLGAGEEKSGGRERASILGSTLEALCGVFYLHYDWEQIRQPIQHKIVVPALKLVREEHLVDYKSQLQEWSQRHAQTVPEYRVVKEGGPDHAKQFEIEVSINGESHGIGHGRRKKVAENAAAREALGKLAGTTLNPMT